MQVTFLHQLNLFGFLSVVSFLNNCEVLFVWFFWTHASERQLLYFTHHTHIFFLKRTFFSLYSEYSSSKSDTGMLKTQNIIWTRASGTLRICIWEKNLLHSVFKKTVWELLSGGSCRVSICASVDCFCMNTAEGSIIHRATSREHAGCSLSGQTMWVSYLTSSNRDWQ